MSTILTDDEMIAAVGAPAYLAAGRAIEAAVLAKLAQQEPVAWLMRSGKARWVELENPTAHSALPRGTSMSPLYTHPAPQQADRQRVPDEWRELLMEVVCLTDRPDLQVRASAMLAAAPEAPAQSDAAEAVNETNAILASRYFELLKVVENYEKSGVTCQTFRHFVDVPCAECNSAPEAPAQSSAVDERAAFEAELRRLHALNDELTKAYRKMYNAAAGYSNYCEDSASVRRCERDFEEADAMFRAALAQKGGK